MMSPARTIVIIAGKVRLGLRYQGAFSPLFAYGDYLVDHYFIRNKKRREYL